MNVVILDIYFKINPFIKLLMNYQWGYKVFYNETTLKKQELINKEADEIQSICSNEITKAIKSLSSILSKIKMLISPVLHTAHQIQKKTSNVGLTEVETSGIGCWN